MGWSLVQRSAIECGVSECDLENFWMRRPCPIGGPLRQKEITPLTKDLYGSWTVFQLEKKLSVFYGTRKLFTICDAFTVCCVPQNQNIATNTISSGSYWFSKFFGDYTGCNRRNGPDFGRVFLMLNYTDITQNTYIQSWTVTEIMTIEMCGLLGFRLTVGCRRTLRLPWRHTCPLRPPSYETC